MDNLSHYIVMIINHILSLKCNTNVIIAIYICIYIYIYIYIHKMRVFKYDIVIRENVSIYRYISFIMSAAGLRRDARVSLSLYIYIHNIHNN